MHNIQFVPECFAETELVKSIFGDTGYYNHAGGIHDVSAILRKKDVETYINVGFVDKDKCNIPPYFDEFEIVEEIQEVVFKRHPVTRDYIFMVKPAIEKFILAQLQQIKKQPSDYNLPDDFKKFRKEFKTMHIKNNASYKVLLHDLKVARTSGLEFIIKHITTLKNS